MSDMDAVNSFNAELQSLYDVKPPISKGKMTSITRAALKAVKLYKHVVQSVEKFIQKCKAEYKIPGLYVIDSIIRQSRHQFGPEKDVFAPRFSRNIQTTFVHLYRCPEEDKAKIIRVLNLWQKNQIFSPQVIQPLFDLADPQNPIWEQISQNSNSESGGGNPSRNSNSLNNSTSGSSNVASGGFPSLPPVHFNKKVLDYDYGDGDDDGQAGGGKPSDSSNNPNASNSGNPNNASGGPLDALGSILSNPEILRQLQTLQEQMAAAAAAASYAAASTPEQERQRKLAELSKQEAAFDQRLAETVARLPFAKDCELPLPPDGESRGDSVDQNSNQVGSAGQSNSNVLLPPPFFQQLAEQQSQQQSQQQQQQQLQNLFRNINAVGGAQSANNPFGLPMPFPIQGVPPPFPPQDSSASSSSVPHSLFSGQDNAFFNHLQQQQNSVSNNQHHLPQISISQKIYEEIDLCEEDSKDPQQAAGLRSSDRDRAGRSKRSRSHDRHDSTRRSRRSRSRSRSRDRGGGRSKRSYRSRSRERAREDREKEKERQRKGLPVVKREHLSVCSTTLWVGHLSKLVSQEEISDTFGAYGDIVSIDLIPPRGCAFIVMNRRQDAVRALDRLKNTKLQGKTITLAWAPGKGMKGKEWKDYWEVGDGVSYIPWSKLRDDINLEEFEDGGCIDEDTLPDFLKNKPHPPSDTKSHPPPLPPVDNENSQDSNSLPTVPPPQPPLPPPSAAAPLIPGLVPGLAGVVASMGDTDARDGQPTMGPGPFGMGPPGMGMMPMGMNLMVPPPMLAAAMGPGNPFQGMASLPGMPPMMGIPGMVPAPAMPVPPGGGPPPPPHPLGGAGAPGLLGEMPQQPPAGIPPPQQLNDSLLNSSNEESAMSASELMAMEDSGPSKRGKKRSRFDDPDDKLSPSMDNSKDNGNHSPSQDRGLTMKDDRPVFERLKSLAEGYSFANNDKVVPGSLLGNPPGIGGGPRPLMPNSFSQTPPSLMANRPPVRPLFGSPANAAGQPRHQNPNANAWAGGFGENTENPFLNPNPNNPFAAAAASGAGNPFVNAGTFSVGSENPFEIVANSQQGNPFAALSNANDNGFGGLGGGRRGGWSRDEWGGGRGGRGGRGRGWRGRASGGWGSNDQMDDLMNETDESLVGGFRGARGGRGGGRRDNSWSRDNNRPRSREGDNRRKSRSPSQRRGDDNDRGNRRRRNSPEHNSGSERRSRHRSGEDRRDRDSRYGDRGRRERDNNKGGYSHPFAAEESWEDAAPQVNAEMTNAEEVAHPPSDNWQGEEAETVHRPTENWEGEEWETGEGMDAPEEQNVENNSAEGNEAESASQNETEHHDQYRNMEEQQIQDDHLTTSNNEEEEFFEENEQQHPCQEPESLSCQEYTQHGEGEEDSYYNNEEDEEDTMGHEEADNNEESYEQDEEESHHHQHQHHHHELDQQDVDGGNNGEIDSSIEVDTAVQLEPDDGVEQCPAESSVMFDKQEGSEQFEAVE